MRRLEFVRMTIEALSECVKEKAQQLPPDAEVYMVTVNPEYGAVEIYFEHDSFKEKYQGGPTVCREDITTWSLNHAARQGPA